MTVKKYSALFLLMILATTGAFAQSLTVSVPDTTADAGQLLDIPVTISEVVSSDGVLSGDWTFEFNRNIITIESVETTGTLLAGKTVDFNPTTGKFAFADATALEGTGTLLILKVKVNAEAAKFQESQIAISNARFNEGDPELVAEDGSVTIRGINIAPKQPFSPLVVGQSSQFNLNGTVTPPVVWSSSADTVATVTSQGLVEGISPGSIRIYAEDAAGLVDSTNLFRIEPATLLDLTVSVSDASVFQTLIDTVQVNVSDITGLNILSGQLDLQYPSDKIEILSLETESTLLEGRPAPVFNKENNRIRIVFADAVPYEGEGALVNIRFRVFREATGTAVLTPQNVQFNETLSAVEESGTIAIVPAPVPIVDPSELNITKGENRQFSVLSGGSGPYSWSIEDESVAVIDSTTGLLQALKRGITQVIATDSNNFQSAPVTVKVNDVTVTVQSGEILDDALVTIPVETMDITGLGILAYEFEVEYDTTVANFEGVTTAGTISDGSSVLGFDDNGVIKVALATATPLSGVGSLVNLQFTAAEGSANGDSTGLLLREFLFNEPGVNTATATCESGSLLIRKTIVPAPIQLLSPANGAVDISLRPAFSWVVNENSQTYNFELSTSDDFANPLLSQTGLNSTTYSVSSDLDFETVYYWRVRGVNQDTEGLWSSPYSFTTIPQPDLTPPVLISPENGAVNLPSTVTFSWNTVDEATEYSLLLSTDQTFTTVDVDSTITGTELTISDLQADSNYFWKVKATDGQRESESEVRTFSTQFDELAAPQLLSPADQATGIDTLATVSWQAVENAGSYRVEISESNTFSGDVQSVEGEGLSAQFGTLSFETTYYWRAKATFETIESEWSSVFSFTTVAQGDLSPPSLNSPENGATGLPSTVTFSWNSVVEATEYSLILSTDQTFATVDVDSTTTGTELTISDLQAESDYFWKVKATDGQRESESEVRTFSVEAESLPVPQLISPEDGAIGLDTLVTFSWSEVNGASSYRVEGSLTNQFSENVITAEVSETTIEVGSLDFETTYFWRVQAIAESSQSNYSTPRSFTTRIDVPGMVLLRSPENEAENVSRSPLFNWQEVAQAESYTLQLSISSEFTETDIVADSSGIEGVNVTLNEELEPLTNYYWRVRAVNSMGFGGWSQTSSFTTEMATTIDVTELPYATKLNQNYPNPFNPTTIIPYQIAVTGTVRLEIFDTLGRQVELLVNEIKTPGKYEVSFNALSLSTGIYISRLQVNDDVQIRKMLLVK